jgi:hypothetical protein
MNTLPSPPPEHGLRQHESFTFSTVASLPSIQHHRLYMPGTQPHANPDIIQDPTSPTPLSSELKILSIKAPICPLCKGQKYGFTAYFHNPKIFSEPPHELLPLIEKSYALKNRLKSLLVTYIMRDLEDGGVQDAEKEVLAWSQMVDELLCEVVASAPGFGLEMRPLEEVRVWTKEMVKQVRESICGRQKLEMPKGRLVVLLLEFRKLWESVWKQCLLDRKNGGSSQELLYRDGGTNHLYSSHGLCISN